MNSTVNNLSYLEDEKNIDLLQRQKDHALQRLRGYRYRGWIQLVFVVVGALFGYSIFYLSTGQRELSNSFPHMIFGGLISGFIYFYIMLMLRITIQSRIRRIDYQLVKLGAYELQDNIEDNFFTKLVKINFKYLDQYYMQTQEQANKSFNLSMFASMVGFLIITVGIIMMYINPKEFDTALITTSAGVITEAVASLFFYLYNQTVIKMAEYHQKLVVTQNISLALKISEDIDAELKGQVQSQIIDRLTTDINKYLTSKD